MTGIWSSLRSIQRLVINSHRARTRIIICINQSIPFHYVLHFIMSSYRISIDRLLISLTNDYTMDSSTNRSRGTNRRSVILFVISFVITIVVRRQIRAYDWMQRLSRSLIRFETQDIKTQPLFNHFLSF